MRERSLFYGLPLEGCGTGEVESLRSYIERLAVAHSFKPRGLLETLFSRYPLGADSFNPIDVKDWNVHGHSETGLTVLRRLELATLQPLQSATMHRFRHVLSPGHLVRRRLHMYCPECYAQSAEPTHSCLLWELSCVLACPKHGVMLRPVKRCGAPVTDWLPINRRPAMKSVCNRCGTIGLACVAETPVAATRECVWVAQQAAALIALKDEDVRELTRETLVRGLRKLVNEAFGGRVVDASLTSGLARATVHNWIAGPSRPNLPMLLQLCLCAKADLLALMRGHLQPATEADTLDFAALPDLAPRTYVRSTASAQAIEAALRDALLGEPVVTIRETCAKLGITTRRARKLFPHLVRELGARFVAHARLEHERRFQRAVVAYGQAAEELSAEGKVVGAKYVQQRAGLVAFSQNPLRARALQDVLAKRSRTTTTD